MQTLPLALFHVSVHAYFIDQKQLDPPKPVLDIPQRRILFIGVDFDALVLQASVHILKLFVVFLVVHLLVGLNHYVGLIIHVETTMVLV